MVSQEEMKAQLKHLMQLPENLVCVDCDDKRPTWASLLQPPPGSSRETPIGCFCCYQCSGAHRRMGTHICFVRSTNLDEWKEKELLAMKEGGNSLINGLFEAKLSNKQKSTVRPDNHTGLDERSTFIYDKYQHRKWYSEEAYKKLKLREKADIALQKDKAALTDCAMEEDFFAARTAKKNTSSGERFAAGSNDENEWWKDDGRNAGQKQSTSQSSDQGASKSLGFLGDRRNLLSNLQMESKSKLMNDLTGLGIDNEKGTLPSQIKTKTSRNSRRERKNGLSPVPQEDRTKSSASFGKVDPMRTPPNRSKSSASSSSGGEGSRADTRNIANSQLIRRAPPGRSVSGPLPKVRGSTVEMQLDTQSARSRKPRESRDIGRVESFDDSSRKKGSRHSSRSSSVKRSRGAARKNRTLVASLYDGTLTDSIATGLATVAGTDDTSTIGPNRRRRGDDESQASTRRGDEKSMASFKSGRSMAREDTSQTGSRRSTSNRKVRSPNRRRDGINNSVSRTPSPDLTNDSRCRALPIATPPRTPTKGTPIKVRRIPKEMKPRPHS